MNKSFSKYNCVETIMHGPKKIVRKVCIKNGVGNKSVATYTRNKRTGYVNKKIHDEHMNMIQERKFVPGLFQDCTSKKCKKNKTMKKYN